MAFFANRDVSFCLQLITTIVLLGGPCQVLSFRDGNPNYQIPPASSDLNGKRGLSPTEFKAFLMQKERAARNRLTLRGGHSTTIFEQAIDGHGLFTAHVQVLKDERGVRLVCSAPERGLEMHWGVVVKDISSLEHPKVVTKDFGIQLPKGSTDLNDKLVRTPMDEELHIAVDGTRGGSLDDFLGIRFKVFDSKSGRVFPMGENSVFAPFHEHLKHLKEIKTDYGTLEERLAKRTNLPIALDGDDRREHQSVKVSASHAQPQSENSESISAKSLSRVNQWVDGLHHSQTPHSTTTNSDKMSDENSSQAMAEPDTRIYESMFECLDKDGKTIQARLIALKETDDEREIVRIKVIPTGKDIKPIAMHWSVGYERPGDWKLPRDYMIPSQSNVLNNAVQTNFDSTGVDDKGVPIYEIKLVIADMNHASENSALPIAINFVLKDAVENRWYKTAGGSDFHVPLTRFERGHKGMTDFEADVGNDSLMIMPILEFESRGGLSLMERFRTARDMITSSQSREMLRHLFVWLRFSQTRQLSWQRRHNTKPRELADEIQILSEVVAKYWKSSQSASDRDILRMMLSTIPRGGGDGQRIRDEILVIMRKFEIKKRKGTWMEEWHQKLHNNCTPDDIYICEAYIKFLQSNGDLKAFYSHLSKFGLDKQRLQTFERPILQDPIFFPSIKNGLINELSNYLQILKSVHAGADLEHSHDLCRGFLPGNLNALVEAVKVERTHPSPAYQETFTSFFNSVAARRLLWESILHEQHVPKVRDLLYLDIALQDQSRMMVEGVLSSMQVKDLALWLLLSLESLCYTLFFSSNMRSLFLRRASSSVDEDLDSSLLSLTSELVEILRDWSSLLQTVGINMEEWKSKSHRHALLAAAYLDRLERMLSQLADRCHRLFQPIAEQLGGSIRRRNPDKTPETWNIAMFTEGVVRGGVGFAVSLIHQKAVQAFRRSGVLPSWQVISPGSRRARGVVMIADVKDVQFKSFDCPTVLLSSRVSGEEEIPEGVVAVITQDSPDVLSHIAVRARNTHVMFASCFDLASFHQFLDFDGKDVVCQVLEQRVSIEMAEGAMDDMVDSHTSHGSSRRMEEEEEERSTPPSKFVYLESEILEEGKKVAGGKTMNLLNVRRRLPDWIKTPKSALIPFGVFQYVLQHQDNRDSQRKYAEIVKQLGVLDAEDIPSKLQDIKNIILDLKVPDEVRADIARSLQDGVFRQVVVDEQESLDCIKRVWSSVWNERAFLSCKKAGISNERIRMAVLLQQIVEAEYAFVVHTVNPLNLDPSEIYIEIAKGHGEAIVGNFPGRSLSVVCRRGSHEVLRIESMPSKSVMLRARGLVFRSDSDAEDLHDFAGAGLFDSVPLVDYEREIIGYRKDPIIQTTSELDKLVMNICKLAEEVEGAMGGKPQDIEGCWSGGSPYVVQSRPQVGV